MSSPVTAACTGSDVYVADFNSSRVQKFIGAGTYLNQWARRAGDPGNSQRNNSERISAMKRLIVFVMATMLWPGAAAWSQEVFPNVQYISGRAALPEKIKGSLVLTATELRFNNEKGDSVMVLPLSIIKEVTNSVEHNPGSTGAKIMLGVFASKKEEYLYVNTETTEVAEALVFKCKNKTSPGMMAKIHFQMKKTAGAAMKPAPVTQAAPADSASRDSAKTR